MKYVFLLFIILLLISCDVSSPKDVNKSLVKDILYEIESAFRLSDTNKIMTYYHPDFQHNQATLIDVQNLWFERNTTYLDIEITSIEISFPHDNRAIASFELSLIAQDYIDTTAEPSVENGDISYFVKESGVWKICGKDYADISFESSFNDFYTTSK